MRVGPNQTEVRHMFNYNIRSDRSSLSTCSVAKLYLTLCNPMAEACQASLSSTIFWSLHKPMCTELVMPSNYLILCCPFLLLPSIFPINRVFSNESSLRIRQLKYWSFSFSTSPSNEQSGLISLKTHWPFFFFFFFKTNWLDLLAVQGTLKSLLRHHSQKASIFGTQSSLQSNSHIHT